MADEYIKRKDAIDYIEGFVRMNKYYHPYSKSTTIPIAEAIARINLTPSADVVEVKHGEWLPIIDGNEYGESYQVGCYCSNCGVQLSWEFAFCPDCGCDMRKDGGT